MPTKGTKEAAEPLETEEPMAPQDVHNPAEGQPEVDDGGYYASYRADVEAIENPPEEGGGEGEEVEPH